MLFVNHRRSKLPRGRAVGTSRHDEGKRQKENPIRAHLHTTSWHPCGASLAGQGRTYIPPWVVSCVLGSFGERNTTFANLAICKRSIAPKVYGAFESLASIENGPTPLKRRGSFISLVSGYAPKTPKSGASSPAFFISGSLAPSPMQATLCTC